MIAEFFTQDVDITFPDAQFIKGDLEFHIAFDGGQLFRQRQLLDVFAERFTDFAFDFIGVIDQVFECFVLSQPFRCGFRADFRHTGDIVRGVAHQRQIINDLIRTHTKFFTHSRNIGNRRFFVHGVNQRHVFIDQLRHVFIARGNKGLLALLGCVSCESAQHIIGFDARNAQQRNPHRLNNAMQWLDLHAQFLWHRWAIGFVLVVEFITKSRAFGVKHHRELVGVVFIAQAFNHVQYAIDCTCRLTTG